MLRKASIVFSLLIASQWTSDALSENAQTFTYELLRKREMVRELPELTMENVQAEIELLGIQHPDIVLRQVVAETGWLKCKHCSLKFNNIFGFATNSGYLKFEHWTEAVAYYKRWQDKYYKGGDYYQFLIDIHYATGQNYINFLKSLY
jgi:hypothetical protein